MTHIAPHEWLHGEGEMACRIREHDWSATPLGPIEQWPSLLRVMLITILDNPLPMVVAWGPEFTTLHNEAYCPLLGGKSDALGRSFLDVWQEAYETIAPQIAEAFAGNPTRLENAHFVLWRSGRPEEAFFDYSFSPIRDEHGAIAGMLNIAVETTGRLMAERRRTEMDKALRESEERQAFLLKLSDATRPLTDAVDIQKTAMKLLTEYFRVMRATYFEVEADQDEFTLAARYEHDPAPIPERMRLSDFAPDMSGAYRAGRTLAVRDTEIEAPSEPERAAYRAISVRAWAAVPLVKQGRLLAIVGVHSTHARDWTGTDLKVLEGIAERTWAAVERARAEAALRASETTLRRNEARLAAQKEAFQIAMNDGSLEASLGVLTTAVTNHASDQLRCAFYIANGRGDQLTHVVGMPQAYAELVNGFEISPESLACGLAVATGQPIITRDVLNEPRWAPWTWMAREHDYRGCWSFPVETAAGRLVGSFAMYFRDPHEAQAQDIELADMITQTAAIIISRHQQNEQRLRSEERLQQFGRASQDILWIRDASTLQWQYLTPAFETVYGLSCEEALEGDNFRSWLKLILPEDRASVEDALRRVRQGEHVTFDYRIRRPLDGGIRWMRDTDFPIADAQGEITLLGGVGHDLTDYHEAELRLKTLMEGIPQLVWRAIDRGQWTWSSPQWAAYTGLSREQSAGYGWLDALHPDDREAAGCFWNEAAQSGHLTMEVRMRQASSCDYRWFQTRATPVRDERGAIIEWLGTSTDIHDMRELQERQQVLVAELQHRTRNLMGVIRSIADKTGNASLDFADFRERFRDRLDALARVQGLLSRLNDHDRVTFDELVQAELSALDASGEQVSTQGPVGVRLRSSTVQVLAMALHELATNALKYGALSRPAGHLNLTWSVERSGHDGKPWLHIDWKESGVAMPEPASTAPGVGQGRELIEQALPYQLRAKTGYAFEADGVHCTISLPVSESTHAGVMAHA